MNTPETPTPRTDVIRYADYATMILSHEQIERENAQLRKELEEAKRQAQVSDTERRAFISELESVQQGLINDRDHFKSLAQTNWKMAEELANNMEAMLTPFEGHPVKDCDEPYCVVCGCDKALSRFQTLKQQQPK